MCMICEILQYLLEKSSWLNADFNHAIIYPVTGYQQAPLIVCFCQFWFWQGHCLIWRFKPCDQKAKYIQEKVTCSNPSSFSTWSLWQGYLLGWVLQPMASVLWVVGRFSSEWSKEMDVWPWIPNTNVSGHNKLNIHHTLFHTRHKSSPEVMLCTCWNI